MSAVVTFIDRYAGEQLALLSYFHELLGGALELTPKIRYGIPFYYGRRWICYLNPLSGGGVELVFTRGRELSNAQGLLEARERKQVRGIELRRMADIPKSAILEIIHEAILLDEC